MNQIKAVFSRTRDAVNTRMLNFIPTSRVSKMAKALVLVLTLAVAFPMQVQAAAFITEAIDILGVVIIAIGGGLGIWGVVNLLEGYGNDNPGANAQVS